MGEQHEDSFTGSSLSVPSCCASIARMPQDTNGCGHPACVDQAATLTHVLMTCPLAAAVWDWFAATWAAITGEDASPRSTDLLLADDQRTWRPATQLRPLWHSLPASAPPAGRSAVCGRSSCSNPFLIQESSAWRLAACNHQADRGRAQRLVARARPQAHAGGVQATVVPPGHPLRAGRGTGCAAPHPLERAPPSAAARMTLAT